MVLDRLGGAFKKGFDKLAGAVFVDKVLVDSVIKELQRALLESDVDVLLVKDISDSLRKAAVDERLRGVEKREHIIKLLHDKLLGILGGVKKELVLDSSRDSKNFVLFVGTYGVGKTTTIHKMAQYYSKRGFKVAMLGLDVHRPAASEQLLQLGKKINLPVFVAPELKDPLKVIKKFKKELDDYNLILVDTAGRHNLDKDLVKEVKNISKALNPKNSLLVIPADIGQAVKSQAITFKDELNITGVVITRMDSSARGGGALTACSQTNTPVFFIGTGESVNDLESFNPSSFISRILGLGDIDSLLEKVQSVIDERSQKKSLKKLQDGKFSLLDFSEQLDAMSGVGSLSKIAGMIPGLGKLSGKVSDDALSAQEAKVKKWKHIIGSMTPYELENPEILDKERSRITRIAKGSGANNSDVKALLKQYSMIKEFSGSGDMSGVDPSNMNISQKQLQKLAKKFGKRR